MLPPHPHELMLSPDGKTIYASIYTDGVYGNNVHPGHEIVMIDLAAMKSSGVMIRIPIRVRTAWRFIPTDRSSSPATQAPLPL